jgi:hypothetical protein
MVTVKNGPGRLEERRLPWQAPAVRRLRAGDAENAAGPTADDPINHS